MERPILDKNLDSKTFRNYYFLKEELVDFCRKNGLPTNGSKIEITDRIAHFLDTGENACFKRKKPDEIYNLISNRKHRKNTVFFVSRKILTNICSIVYNKDPQ